MRPHSVPGRLVGAGLVIPAAEKAEIEDNTRSSASARIHHELTEPPLDRLSLYAHRRIKVEIRFGLSSGP